MEVVRVCVLLALSSCVNTFEMNKDEYLRLRNNVLDKEYQMRIGGKIKLSDAELQVNNILMKLKANELDMARTNTTNYPPAVHFFRAKALIDKSKVFSVIKNMPKGKRTQYSNTGRSSSHCIKPVCVVPGLFVCWIIRTVDYSHHR